MAVSVYKFHRTKELILGGGVSLLNDNLYMMLLRPGFQYSSSLSVYSQIEALEVLPTLEYPTGGNLISGKSTSTTVEGVAEFRIGGLEYNNLVTEISHAILYADITALGLQKPLLAVCDFGTTLSFKNSIFQFQWPEPLMRW